MQAGTRRCQQPIACAPPTAQPPALVARSSPSARHSRSGGLPVGQRHRPCRFHHLARNHLQQLFQKVMPQTSLAMLICRPLHCSVFRCFIPQSRDEEEDLVLYSCSHSSLPAKSQKGRSTSSWLVSISRAERRQSQGTVSANAGCGVAEAEILSPPPCPLRAALV